MKATLLGAFGGTVLLAVVWLLAGRDLQALAQRPGGQNSSSDLITITAPVGDGRQQLTVIDPQARVMSVYHVELATGAVTLKSVRNIHWDLQMDDFNASSPLPRDIRNLLEAR